LGAAVPVLRPAAAVARRGWGLDDALVEAIADEQLIRFPASAALYLPGGSVPAAGTVVRNPGLAATARGERLARVNRIGIAMVVRPGR